MKKYLTVLLAAIALPVFGAGYPNGVTQIGDPYAGRIYLGDDPIVQMNEGLFTQDVALTMTSVLPGVVNLNWTAFTNLNPAVPNLTSVYGVWRAPHGTALPDDSLRYYPPSQLSTNIPPWVWVNSNSTPYGVMTNNFYQDGSAPLNGQWDYWVYLVGESDLPNWSSTYPFSSNYNVVCLGCSTTRQLGDCL